MRPPYVNHTCGSGAFHALQMGGWLNRFRTTLAGQGAALEPKDIPMNMDLTQLVFPLLLIGIMYFILIRPQQQKLKKHQEMVANLRRGDQVVTQGGVIGKVSKVKDENEIEVEIAEGVKVRVVKSTITQVLNKTEPAADA